MTKTDYKAFYRQAQFLHLLGHDLERISGRQDPSRVVRFALRRIGEAIEADVAIQVDLRRSDGNFERPYSLALKPGQETEPVGGAFLDACREFLRRPLGPSDRNLLLLRIVSEDRCFAVLGFRRRARVFSREETRTGQDAAEILSENLRHRERERAQDLKERIYAKILAEMRPQDVLYQILHGLKRLFQYDHGGAVLLLNAERTELTVQAEIVAWTKAKSERIGERLPLTAGSLEWLDRPSRPVLVRAGEPEPEAEPLPSGLAGPLLQEAPGSPPARGMMVAVLRHRQRALGILQIRSRSAVAFTPSDLRTLEEFLPLASVTVYNSAMYKTQHDLLLSAERKSALADLARAISHDLNNAFGVMLPLLQALRRDLESGTARPEQIRQDLEVVERYARTGSRIFQGLLSAARGAAEPALWSDLNNILEAILRMMGPNLESRGIQVRKEFDRSIPRAFLRRGEMEQLFLNLIYNARDAMSRGGVLSVRTKAEDGAILVEVMDTGAGIPEEIRSRVFEPFFTTKHSGSGLGLDICRSIVWDYDGRIDLDSSPGRGTRVTVRLPLLCERLREEAERAGTPAADPGGIGTPSGKAPRDPGQGPTDPEEPAAVDREEPPDKDQTTRDRRTDDRP